MNLLICFLVVPVLTLALGMQEDWIMVNFTGLMYREESFLLALIWSVCAAFGLNYCIVNIGKLDKRRGLLIALFMFFATRFPYSETNMFYNFTHVALGYMSTLLLNYHLYLMYIKNRNKFLLNCYLVIIGLCAGLILQYGGITGLVEVIYTISVSILLGLVSLKKYLHSLDS